MLPTETRFSKFSHLLEKTQTTTKKGNHLTLEEGFNKVIEWIFSIRSDSKKVMVVGNGGSAAIANHMQNDLCKTIKVRALTFFDLPLLTAYSNDHGYENAFGEMVDLWVDQGDMLIAISSSGQSENILHATRIALEHNARCVTFSGFKPDNPLRKLGHFNFYVSAEEYGYVEAIHSVLTHFLTDQAKIYDD